MNSTKMQNYTLSFCEVRDKTNWTFLEIKSESGFSGIAEITMPGHSLNKQLIIEISNILNKLKGYKIASDNELISKLGEPENTSPSCVISGIRNAFADVLAKENNLPLNIYLRVVCNKSVKNNIKKEIPLYANINRSMSPLKNGPVSRTAVSFADVAKKALKDGFKIIKCAPFDECNPSLDKSRIDSALKPGLERVSQIKNILDYENKLLVDCHRRFNFESALSAEKRLRSIGASWFEEPLDPLTNKSLMKDLRKLIHLPLVGAEEAYGLNTFINLFQSKSLNIFMPDIKYCGGVVEATKIGLALEALSRGSISIHCPSGPISLLASAHVTSAIGSPLPLEHAVYEVDWRKSLINPNENIKEGNLIIPEGFGLAASLNYKLLTILN